MSFLTYKPNFKYEYQEINTINSRINVAANQSKYNPKEIDLLQSTVQSLVDKSSTLYNDYIVAASDIAIPFIGHQIDTTMSEIAANSAGGSAFLQNGLITQALILDAGKNPLFNNVKYVYDVQNSGINGNILAELLPYAEKLQKISLNLQLVLDKTKQLCYNKLKDSEFFNNYIGYRSQLANAIENGNANLILDLQKDMSTYEKKIEHVNRVISIIEQEQAKMNEIYGMLKDAISEDTYKEYTNEVKVRAEELKLNFGDMNIAEAVIYSNFNQIKKELEEGQATTKISLSNKSIELVHKDLFDSSTLYIKACSEVLPALVQNNSTFNDKTSDIIVNGLLAINERYQGSILTYKNFVITQSNQLLNDIVNIYNKNDSRLIYQNL